MSLEKFMNDAISPWMRTKGPEDEIVLSSRIRLARNFQDKIFPTIADETELASITSFMEKNYDHQSPLNNEKLELIKMNDLHGIEKRVLVEKHLISPHLAKAKESAALISKNEQVSIMINEEDHVRIQMYFPGFQLNTALKEAFQIDDWIEEKIDYAFDETKGYLTSCPTNVGTGMRASVMIHLPALVFTKNIQRMIPAINQLGFVVRGIYGEGSEAQGNVFQISNQITLGKSEEDIIDDLQSIIRQLIEQERNARKHMMEKSKISVENRVFRSYGILKHSRIIESKEAASRISLLRLGIDLNLIDHISRNILNELMVLTQPGFLQQYANKPLNAKERDVLRASLIRDRLTLSESK